jgi:hypothetical protein
MEKTPGNTVQLIWGIALVAAGIGMLVRIPQVMPQIQTIAHFAPAAPFIRFCFYFMAVILIGGGLKKIKGYFYPPYG